MFPLCSGTAATPDLLFLLLPFNTTRSRSTSISAPSVSACGLYPHLPYWNKRHHMSVSTAYQQSLVAASLYVDYIFLDTDERRKMAQNPHEYLIEQVQFTGDESVGSSSNKIKLNFNHPCKELVWVVQPDANVDYCASLEQTPPFSRFLELNPSTTQMLLMLFPTPSTPSVLLPKHLEPQLSSTLVYLSLPVL